MRRTSTRVRPITYTEAPSDSDADEVDQTGDFEPKKMRAKKRKAVNEGENEKEIGSTKKPRRKRGLLKDLIEMPIDILFEIFAQTDPLDLVHISRTTKAFRAMLMHRSSKPIWRSARSHFEELPDCPDDLSEAQYAILLFTRYCSFCLRNVAVYTSWSARVRTCKKCLDDNFDYINRERQLWGSDHHNLYPTILASWLPLLKMPPLARRRDDTWYKYTNLDRQWKEEYKAIVSLNRKIEWVNERLKERYAIEQHARKCELWHMKYQATPTWFTRSDILVAEGKQKVAQFINELGFGDVLAKVSNATYPHPLDESYLGLACAHGFGEADRAAVKDRLITTFKSLPRGQEIMEYSHIFQTRKPFLSEIRTKAIQEYPVGTALPPLRDIHELAEQHGFVDYSKPAAEALSVPFSEVLAIWKASIESKLFKLMADDYGEDYTFDRKTALNLATTFFGCTNSHCHLKSMRSDCVMVHDCAVQSQLCNHSNGERLSPRELALQQVFSTIEWNSIPSRGCIRFGKEEWKTMTKVVEMVGLDPKTATAKEMEELNVIFECLPCNDVYSGRATMTWAAVREHMRLAHHENSTRPPMDLAIVTGSDAEEARKQIYVGQMRKAYSASAPVCLFICTHCKSTVKSGIKAYQGHLQTECVLTCYRNLHDDHELCRHEITALPMANELVFAPDQELIPPVFRLWPPRYDNPSDQAIEFDTTSEMSDIELLNAQRRAKRASTIFGQG